MAVREHHATVTRVRREAAALLGHAHHGSPRRAAPRTPSGLALQLQRTIGNAATGRLLSRAATSSRPLTGNYQDDIVMSHWRPTGSAFVQGEGEHESGIDANDVAQGALNDCFFLSPLMAVARINPNWIRRMIRGPVQTLDDGTRVFEVDLYAKSGTGTPRLRTVRVYDKFVTDQYRQPRFAKYGDMGAAGPELWPMLFEQAYAELEGGYDKIEWRPGTHGLMALTGHEGKWGRILDFIPDEMVFRIISECVRDGKPVTMLTHARFAAEDLRDPEVVANGWKVPPRHIYNVAAVDPSRKTLDIMDPYGRYHLRGFPLAKVRKFFIQYEWSGVSVR